MFAVKLKPDPATIYTVFIANKFILKQCVLVDIEKSRLTELSCVRYLLINLHIEIYER